MTFSMISTCKNYNHKFWSEAWRNLGSFAYVILKLSGNFQTAKVDFQSVFQKGLLWKALQTLHRKSFPLRISSANVTKPQFMEETHNEKLYFFAVKFIGKTYLWRSILYN